MKQKFKFVFEVMLIVAAVCCITLEWGYLIHKQNHARMTFIGHASVKIVTTNGKVIYIDPYYPTVSYREPADYILVTHSHSDHNAVRLCTKKPNCLEINSWDALKDGEYQIFDDEDVKIEAVPSGGNVNHDVRRCVGYIVTMDGVSVFHAGDTSMNEHTQEIVGKKIDYAMYPIDGRYDMGPEEASEMADLIGATHNIPIHGDGDKYFQQREVFSGKGKRILQIGETIFLK